MTLLRTIQRQTGGVLRWSRQATPMLADQDEERTFSSFEDLPFTYSNFKPSCVMLIGKRGRGKTQALTGMGAQMATWYENEHYGRRVYANYINLLADKCDSNLVQNILNPFGPVIRNGLLLIDELQEVANARKSLTRQNFNLNNFLTQIRKDNLECAFTTQNAAMIDKNVLWQIDTFVEAKQYYGGNVLLFAVHDWNNNIIESRRKRYFPPMWHEADWYIGWANTRFLFDFYFDQQRVQSEYLDPEIREMLANREWKRFGHPTDEWQIDPADLAAPDVKADPSWDGSQETAGGPATAAPVAAPSLESYLISVKDFNVLDTWRRLRKTKQMDLTATAFHEWLVTLGFTFEQDGGTEYATWPHS